jgi:hypothetical protein
VEQPFAKQILYIRKRRTKRHGQKVSANNLPGSCRHANKEVGVVLVTRIQVVALFALLVNPTLS